MRDRSTPIIVDIEASGFGPHSYPIEIGAALSDGVRYCSLIEPSPTWTHWDDSAEDVHKISRQLLGDQGKPPQHVARELNELLANQTVYSDGWVVDEPWIIRLFEEAKLRRSFAFYDIQTILSEAQMDIWHKTKEDVIHQLHIQRHRASNDAHIIQQTYIRTVALSQNHDQLMT